MATPCDKPPHTWPRGLAPSKTIENGTNAQELGFRRHRIARAARTSPSRWGYSNNILKFGPHGFPTVIFTLRYDTWTITCHRYRKHLPLLHRLVSETWAPAPRPPGWFPGRQTLRVALHVLPIHPGSASSSLPRWTSSSSFRSTMISWRCSAPYFRSSATSSRWCCPAVTLAARSQLPLQLRRAMTCT